MKVDILYGMAALRPEIQCHIEEWKHAAQQSQPYIRYEPKKMQHCNYCYMHSFGETCKQCGAPRD